jgi:signal transduction histidine kinase/CheY-like chemotaxis protein
MNPSIKPFLNCSLFQNIPDNIIEEVLSEAEVTIYKPGQKLIEKGTVPSGLFIIESGTASIYNEDILLAELGSMAIMGESFLADGIATATILAKDDLKAVEIKKDKFYSLSQKYPALVFNIFTINFQRLRNSNNAALQEARTREEKLEQLVQIRTKELNETMEELKTTNNELSITRDNLIETQKFRDQFLANMSHEIRTPMNAIVGLTNLLTKSPLTELQDKYLKVIKKSGENLLVIINDILDLAKIEAGKMELENVPFPLISVIHNVQVILNLKTEEKGIAFNTDIDPQIPEYVFGDETRFTQVIMNLAGNAIKFTEKGAVTISAKLLDIDGDYYEIRFGVKDTGIGIPADRIEKIFESFGQASADTTRKFGGTGLGLTISKQLVEMHDSRLQVTSTKNVGSEFFFVVRYKVAAAPQSDELDAMGQAFDVSDKIILLVEDNEFNQMVAVDTLQDLFPGIKVDIAENGTEAVAKVEANEYSFILMDIQLPDFDGFEITRRIRKMNKLDLRICAMTASVTKERVDECFEAGMNDYMMKPFSPDVLREKVIRNING